MLKHLFGRLRGFMQAELMAELAASRAELGAMRAELAQTRAELAQTRAEMARRDELAPLARQMEAALLTIALGDGMEAR
jgi:hypothetical protein